MLIWCVGEQGSDSNGVKTILFKLKLVPARLEPYVILRFSSLQAQANGKEVIN